MLRTGVIPLAFGDNNNKVWVYNGKVNILVDVTDRHANLKFGEFSISRSLYAKGILKKKNKRKSKVKK
jgi:ribosomal protein S19